MLKILQFEQDEALFPRFCIYTKKDKAKKIIYIKAENLCFLYVCAVIFRS